MKKLYFLKSKYSLLFYLFALVSISGYAQQHTVTGFTPSYAGTGDVVTIVGTNFSSITNVTFGGTSASSFTVVSSTKITATVGAGTTGAVGVVKTGFTNTSTNGFTYSTLPTVTRIVTDFSGFWDTNTTSNNLIFPNDSHNLLAFSYAGTTYSTGVNDATLSSKGVSYTAGVFKALPAVLTGVTSGSSLYIAAGSKVDGNTASGLYTNSKIKDLTIQNVLTDGINGLNLGTGYTNLPTTAVSNYTISSISLSKINDNEPDILVTQIADPTGTATDTYQFVDASGTLVGNALSINLATVSKLGTYNLDLFTVANGISFSLAKPTGTFGSNTTRDIRFVGFKLSDFGINSSNYTSVKSLKVTPSGVSDCAFMGYNANAINVPPSIAQNTTATNSVVCTSGGGNAFLSVYATSTSGSALSYSWEVSTNSGSSWSTVTNGGSYSNATTNGLNITSAVANYQYRAIVTENSSGLSNTSPVFTITAIINTALAGTLNPTGLTLCLNSTAAATSLSVAPTGGTGTYSYQWSSSPTSGGTYTNISGAVYNNYSPDLSTVGTTYYKVQINSGCTSNTPTATAVTISGDDILSVTNGSTCTAGTATMSATNVSGTASNINWYNVATLGSSLATGSSYSPSISSTTTYYVGTTTGGCSSARQAVVATLGNSITLSSANFNISYTSTTCTGLASGATIESTGLADGTYTVTYSISGANTVSNSTATLIMSSGVGSFTTSALSNSGSNTITVSNVRTSAGCNIVPSSGNTASITVVQSSVSGTITGATTVCTGTNSTVLTLGSNTGNVTKWQYSSDDFASDVHDVANITTSLTATDLTSTTYYRAVVTSSVCSSATTASVTIAVSTPSVSGSITGATTVCTGTNSTVLTLGGNTGSIQWQSSPNNSTFGDISGATSATYTATNLTATTYYRAVVTNGGCSSATTSSVTMTVSPASVAGSITGATTVCTGTNSTVLTLGSNTGNVSKWQYSSDNFASDVHDVANITTSLTATNLTATTYYRAVVTSGVCSSATTTAVTISVSPASVGGSVSGSATVCSGTNSTTLTLGSNTGNVTKWQSSATSDFASSTDIANTTTSLTATNLTATTYYRAVVTSGACSAANSANATVTVSPTSVGGSISRDATVCSGTNSTDLSLSGYTGSVTKWQSSTVSDFSSAVTDIANITATLTATNLTATTYYRAVVASGSCTSANSAVATITYAPSVGGFVSGSTSVCSGTNSATLTVSSYIGSITKWQSSTVSDFSSAVSDIANTSSSLAVSNISATTYYRAVVQSGSCSADYSDIGTITVTTPSVGGTVSGSTTLLTGVNTATLSLTGNTGDVIKWQSSSVSDFSSNVSDIANITSSLTVNNLNATTYYRAVVESGNCPTANSAIATVTVTASGGGTTSGGATLCSATNSTTLTLSGYTGTIVKWQSSTVIDFTSGVVDIANTTTSLTVTNLTATKYYRAIVAAIGSATQYSSSVSTITYSNVPLIIGEVYGPTDLCGLTSATFGVPVVSGATKYIWTFPAGLSVHSSGGNEVVVNIDPLYISGTITVRAINDCAGINSGTKTISPYKIPVIATITGPTSTCGITTATYIATVLPDATYAWTVPTGMTITSGDTTNTITVAIDSNFTNGNLSCVATNSCGVSNRKILGISSVDGPSNISGPQNACGLTTATYATATVSGASSYSWTVPSGMTITSGQGTISIVVAIQNTFSGGDVAVALNYGCGSSNLRKLPVGVAQTPDAISGPKALCGLGEITYDTAGNILDTAGGIAYYSVAAVYGAISYIWTVPTGATIISGQGTTRVGVSFDYTTFSSGTISVQSQSTCGTSAKSNVIVKRLGGNIIGLTELCNASTARYYLPFTTGSSFKWTVPSWMTITSGQNTSDITVSITGSPCSDTVKIDFVSNCGTTENFVLTVGCSQTSKLVASICGSTIYSESSPIYANAVTGATQYKFKVYDGVQTQYIEQNTPAFTLSNFTGWSYGTTYTVSVAPKVNGSYLAYGCSCSVSLSSPKTQLIASICGSTLTSLYTPLNANVINGATSYKFEVTNGATVRTYTTGTNSFNLMQLTDGAIPSTTYSVKVDALYNGSWLGYGTACNVTTPGVSATELVSSTCGSTITSLFAPLYADPVALATGYRFEVSNAGTTRTYDATSNVFNLMQLTNGAQYNTTYAIRVAALYNGVYQAYGVSCNVTTQATATTSLVSSACGVTLTSLYAPLYANVVTLATGYRFEVSSGGTTRTYDAASNVFNLMQLTNGAQYNTTYSIRVAALYNGVYQTYGTSCNVTTPILVPTTSLVSTACGSTITSLYAPIYANAITLASGYRFEVSSGGVTRTYDATSNVFNLMQLTNGATYGTTYSIRVAWLYNGTYQAYGTSCNVTTQSIGTSQVVASRCGTVLTSLLAPIYANVVSLATGYKFEVRNASTGVLLGTTSDASITNVFSLKQIPGTGVNTAYSIRVALQYNGTWQDYGPSCVVTTAVNAITTRMNDSEIATSVFSVKAFPNPFATSFNLAIESSSDDQVEVKVYDMIGRLLEANKATVSELSTQEIGNNYPSGVYNIIVSQGDQTKTLRMIKR